MNILIFINTGIFISLSLLHFFWLAGGKWALSIAIPTTSDGNKSMHPGIIATLIVAVGLLLFALVTLGSLGIYDDLINRKYIRFGMMAISAFFFLRVMGDFNYVGLTKRVRHTPFARYDNKIYIPLCLIIGTISLILLF